jgi:hypothetical protein
MTPEAAPRTTAGRALLDHVRENYWRTRTTPMILLQQIRDAILAIEAETVSLGHKEGYLSRAEDERFKADFPEAAQPAPGLDVETVAEAMRALQKSQHDTEYGKWRSDPGQDPIYDRLLTEEAERFIVEYARLRGGERG